MKQILILFSVLLTVTGFSQPNFGVEKKDSCYKKAQARAKNRFAEWECGKLAGVVDCNEKLELDPNSGIVITTGNHQPFSGTCETCHMNGLHERTVRFVNGKTEGIDTTTYIDGCIKVIRSHVQGAEHGRWVYYFDSTEIESWVKNYNMGQLHGYQYDFAINGDTIKVEHYVNGLLTGEKRTFKYNPATKHTYMDKKTSYKNGLLDGPFLIYNKDSVIIEETYYKEGKKNGVFKYYYDDGVLLRTENWDMGSRNGEFKTLYYDQTLQSIENYKKASGKSAQYLTADIYTFQSEAVAYGVGKILYNNGGPAKIKAYTDSAGTTYEMYTVKEILQDSDPNLKGAKIGKGVNKPYKKKEVFLVVNITDVKTVAKTEVKEGWFEERFPDQKLKRRALYKNDVLIEETVYDQLGKIVSQVGKVESTGKEDDAMPATKTEKKKKEKKAKKSKKVKEETPTTETGN
jgi:antitoxin component YwqK of YwqJK toxin-antitoxin module